MAAIGLPGGGRYQSSRSRFFPGSFGVGNVIVLSAGRGRRLLPLTERVPKCLLPVGGRSVLEWQIQSLNTCGIPRIHVVVGFGADKVQNVLASQTAVLPEIRTIYNPHFDTADNLISCWTAREAMRGDFLLLNGDTLFEPDVLRRLLTSEPWPVSVAVVSKRVYDADDMKVHCEGASLRQIGKGLAPHETNGESIGMLLFRGDGPRLFRAALERAAKSPLAPRQWYLSVINDMAGEGLVRTVSVDGLDWTEIDYLRDLRTAEQLVAGWQHHGQGVVLQPSA